VRSELQIQAAVVRLCTQKKIKQEMAAFLEEKKKKIILLIIDPQNDFHPGGMVDVLTPLI
jgi:hypothetical protein